MYEPRGFTLIELMSTVAIIGVLAAIALPYFLDHSRKSANHACMAEANAYTKSVLVAVVDGGTVLAPSASACKWITDASDLATVTVGTPIYAYPVGAGDTGTICNVAANSACELNNSVPQEEGG